MAVCASARKSRGDITLISRTCWGQPPTCRRIRVQNSTPFCYYCYFLLLLLLRMYVFGGSPLAPLLFNVSPDMDARRPRGPGISRASGAISGPRARAVFEFMTFLPPGPHRRTTADACTAIIIRFYCELRAATERLFFLFFCPLSPTFCIRCTRIRHRRARAL